MALPIDTTSEDSQKIKEKIKQRRTQMLVHSCLYYELNENIVDDATWQKWADELRDLQKEHPLLCQLEFFDEAFARWDGSTGHHLPLRDPWVMSRANQLLEAKDKGYGSWL